MEFDITHLDKHLILQTLFAHADPLGVGRAEYFVREQLGDNVYGLPDEECELILSPFSELQKGHVRLMDYHKGKPMKITFEKKANARVLVDSDGFDSRNGKYRFLEAMLNIFLLDEIIITKKGYSQYALADLSEDQMRPKEQEDMFKNILKHTVKKENTYGTFWEIDETKVSYTPPFMQKI